MLDIKWIEQNPDIFNLSMKNRGVEIDAITLIELNSERKRLITEIEKEKSVSKKTSLKNFNFNKHHLMDIEARLKSQLESLPNLLHKNVPIGTSEKDNVVR